MVKNWVLFVFPFVLLLFSGSSPVSALPPAKIVTGIVSNVASTLVKKLWSLQSTTKTAVSSRSMMKFESGYVVETVFDGSKLGIEPFSVEVSPTGELLVLDAENSNLYKIPMPLSRFSRPKLIAGSLEGYSGHVDGKLREARMNHPKGLAADQRGNVYIADTMNMAIRKISETGVTTIAGGKWSQGGGHVDGPSEDAKFSNDFDVVYVASSCSLLVIDRGNQAIREIQLNDEDCNYHYDGSFNLGILVLVGAGIFGYLLALLQRWLQSLFSSPKDMGTQMMRGTPIAAYQRPPKSDMGTQMMRGTPIAAYQRHPKSVRPLLIPSEGEPEKPEEGFFGSMGRLVFNTSSSMAELFGGLFSGLKRKPLHHGHHPYQMHPKYQEVTSNKNQNEWPLQESYEIPDEGDPPPPPPAIETQTPTLKKPYPLTTEDLDRALHFKQTRAYYGKWDGDFHQQEHQQQQYPNRHYSAGPKTYYEKTCETNEIVFGAVQVQEDGGRREAMVIKAVDYSDPRYNHHNIRPRINNMGYSHVY